MVVKQVLDSIIPTQSNTKIFSETTTPPEILGLMRIKNTSKWKMHKARLDKKKHNRWYRAAYNKVS
jgi:hypothetical protein